MSSHQPSRRTTAAIAALALLVASCGPGPSTSPSPAHSPEPSPSTSPATPTPVPSPIAIDPVTPTSDTLVARLEVGSDIGAPALAMALYADGSLVDLRSTPATVLRLSPSGLATVIERFRASGLFGESHTIPSPDVPMGFGLFVLTFVDGERTVRVNGSNVGDDPETRALVTLTDGLADPVAWLPQTAFVDGDRLAHPYLARASRVTSEVVVLDESAWTNTAQTIDRVAWPLSTPPAELGDPVPLAGHPERALRCGVISGRDEGVIRAALAEFRPESLDSAARTTGWYAWLPGPSLLRLTLHAFLPDEQADCAAANMPGPPSLAEAPRPSLHALLAASTGGLTPPSKGPDLFAQVSGTGDGVTLGHVSYYADGTILFYDPPAPGVGIGARRLTAEGLAQVRAALEASGLMTGDYNEAVPDGAPDYRVFSIVSGSTILNGSDRGKDPKATAIATLAAKLIDPASWLAAGAWVGGSSAIQPYRPASIRVTIAREEAAVDPWLPRVAALRWPLGGSLDTFGTPDESSPGSRTGLVSVDDALALMLALELTGARASGAVVWAEYRLGDMAAEAVVSVGLGIESGEWGP